MGAHKKEKDYSPSRPKGKPHLGMWEDLDQEQIKRIKEHINKELQHDEVTQKKAALIIEDWLKG